MLMTLCLVLNMIDLDNVDILGVVNDILPRYSNDVFICTTITQTFSNIWDSVAEQEYDYNEYNKGKIK